MQPTKSKPPVRATKRTVARTVPTPPAVAARPASRSDAPARLLDAAELLFADLGYGACTFREIAQRSGINQGLLHYYFATKENLFSRVFLRRGEVVAQRRLAALDAAEATHGAGRVPVEAIVRAFVEPTLRLAMEGEGGRAFLRIHASLRSEHGDLGLTLRRQAFGASTDRFVAALCASCPHLPRASVFWRFNFMVGSYLVVISHGGRLEDYSEGRCASTDLEGALAEIVPFLVAGFLGPPPRSASARRAVPPSRSRARPARVRLTP